MELVAYNDESVTLRFKRKELGVLLGILRTIDIQFDRFDKELLMLSEKEVSYFVEDVFALTEKSPLSGERNVIK